MNPPQVQWSNWSEFSECATSLLWRLVTGQKWMLETGSLYDRWSTWFVPTRASTDRKKHCSRNDASVASPASCPDAQTTLFRDAPQQISGYEMSRFTWERDVPGTRYFGIQALYHLPAFDRNLGFVRRSIPTRWFLVFRPLLTGKTFMVCFIRISSPFHFLRGSTNPHITYL